MKRKIFNKNYNNQNETNSDLISSIEKMQSELNNIINSNEVVENNLIKMFKHLEYKFCENKMLTNLILYKNSLENNKNRYNKDFNPLVSIIIPVYNGSKYLKYAIDSALNQTYKNIEIIVVNDGSNDNGETEKIAKSYGEKIKYISKANGGVSSALNEGIKNMSGDYFAWLSHDDVYFNNHIEKHIEFLRYFNDEKTISYTCFNFIDSNGMIIINDTTAALIHMSDYKLSINSHYACILRGEVNGGNILIPKEAFKKCGLFKEGNNITQEKDMWSRLLKEYNFVNIPIVTSSIRCHPEQVSNTTKENVKQETKNKIIEIINNISENDLINESGSVSNFYLDLYIHYHNNSLDELANEMLRKYKDNLNK